MVKLTNRVKIYLSLAATIVFTISIIFFIYNRSRKLIPFQIFPLDQKHLWSFRVDKNETINNGIDIHTIYDTLVMESYVIEGYLGSDTSEIRKTIWPFFLTKVKEGLHTDRYSIIVDFYRASGNLNKDFIYIEDISDILNNKIAFIEMYYGKTPCITYLNSGEIKFKEEMLNDGTIIRSKFKGIDKVYEDHYFPNGKVKRVYIHSY